LTKIFKNNSEVLFVSKSDHIEKRGKYSVILSPEFYWVKRVTLPVKNERDALKLAPSIYEGFLPEGDFSYEARKVEDAFIMIAYNKKQISEALDKIFVHKSDIVDVYFAQDALVGVESCLAINDNIALSNIDGTIIQIPRACTNTKEGIDKVLESAALGKHKVKLSSFDNTLLSSGDLKVIGTIVTLLLVSFLSEYIVYKKGISDLEAQKDALIEKYDLPKTSIQLKSIKKSLEKKFKTQKALRERLFALSKLSLQPSEYIQSVESTIKDLTVKIHLTSKQREDAIKNMIPKTLHIKESTLQDNILTLKIAS